MMASRSAAQAISVGQQTSAVTGALQRRRERLGAVTGAETSEYELYNSSQPQPSPAHATWEKCERIDIDVEPSRRELDAQFFSSPPIAQLLLCFLRGLSRPVLLRDLLRLMHSGQ